MNNKNKLAILLCTYNGEKYLEEQLDSIFNQTNQNFVLYIRDDNSTDNTQNIINNYANKYKEKLINVKDGKDANCACKNFMFLLEYVYKLNKFDLFMFSDQDDFWLPNKIEIMLNEYNKSEYKNRPLLIHTDLIVADLKLNIINPSFVKYSNLNPTKFNKFKHYLFQNNITGCTILINKNLTSLINFDIEYIRMYDRYLSLLASAFGKVLFINKATVKYRQHTDNVIGAKKIFNMLKNCRELKRSFLKLLKQAESFKKCHYNMLSNKDKKTLNNFLKLKWKKAIDKEYEMN